MSWEEQQQSIANKWTDLHIFAFQDHQQITKYQPWNKIEKKNFISFVFSGWCRLFLPHVNDFCDYF